MKSNWQKRKIFPRNISLIDFLIYYITAFNNWLKISIKNLSCRNFFESLQMQSESLSLHRLLAKDNNCNTYLSHSKLQIYIIINWRVIQNTIKNYLFETSPWRLLFEFKFCFKNLSITYDIDQKSFNGVLYFLW